MALEKQETKDGAEDVSFVDSVLGGEEESHSPETTEKDEHAAADGQIDDGDSPLPEDAEELGFSDSDDSNEEQNADDGKKEPEQQQDKPEVNQDNTALKQEIEGLKKRLHDTQSAMHKATSERAALQKELAELKAKKENEDDWFSEDDQDRVEKLEKEIKKSDEEIARCDAQTKEIEQKNAEAQWDAAAAPVIAQHPDFEKVLYDDFAPLLDPKTGNPQIRAEWDKLKDKSPLSAYNFAKKVLDVLDFQRDPEAYKEKLRKQLESKPNNPGADGNAVPTGKEGLDMLPSADVPTDTKKKHDVSFVDAVFG